MIEYNSQTFQNLLAAFAGESQARNRYSFFAQEAAAEGLETTSELFQRLAKNEEQHAKFWFKYIRDGAGETVENLKMAIDGEHGEWTDMYMRFALQAKDEGYDELAVMFEKVAMIEKSHEEKLQSVLKMLEGGEIQKAAKNEWYCEVCGQVVTGEEPPEVCPVCKASGKFLKND